MYQQVDESTTVDMNSIEEESKEEKVVTVTCYFPMSLAQLRAGNEDTTTYVGSNKKRSISISARSNRARSLGVDIAAMTIGSNVGIPPSSTSSCSVIIPSSSEHDTEGFSAREGEEGVKGEVGREVLGVGVTECRRVREGSDPV